MSSLPCGVLVHIGLVPKRVLGQQVWITTLWVLLGPFSGSSNRRSISITTQTLSRSSSSESFSVSSSMPQEAINIVNYSVCTSTKKKYCRICELICSPKCISFTMRMNQILFFLHWELHNFKGCHLYLALLRTNFSFVATTAFHVGSLSYLYWFGERKTTPFWVGVSNSKN